MITFNNVSKIYPNGVKGLSNINLTIQDGEFISIIGLSGAGKSTLLRSINRLERITEGDIIINDTSITNAKKKELRMLRRQIGWISQNFNLVLAKEFSTRIIALKYGEIIFDGPPEELTPTRLDTIYGSSQDRGSL